MMNEVLNPNTMTLAQQTAVITAVFIKIFVPFGIAFGTGALIMLGVIQASKNTTSNGNVRR